MLQVPNAITKKTFGDRAYMCTAPKLWNSFPNHVRNEIDFGKFKILLKTYLFNLTYNQDLIVQGFNSFYNLDKVL